MIYGYEITGYQGKSHDIIFPSTALFRDVSMQYGVEPKQDYRLNPRAQSFYMKGVMDAGNANAPYKTNASCYTLNLLTPLSDAVLDATEQYWQDITPEEEAVRIISRADMLRLIAEFRDGTKTPDNVPWKVPGVGELADLSALLNPKRVTVAGYDDAEEDVRLHAMSDRYVKALKEVGAITARERKERIADVLDRALANETTTTEELVSEWDE